MRDQMQPLVIWDTDVSSLSIKQRLPPSLEAKLAGTKAVMTFVTWGELSAWVKVRRLGQKRSDEVWSWLDQTSFLPGDEAVADVWGGLAAAAQRRGRPRPENDMWIAACCLARGLPLATLNVKDFHDFAVYHGLDLITA
jgi:predicted nucleic acid-binding protein